MEGYIKMLGDFQAGFMSLSGEIDSRVGDLQRSGNI
jgi:hypothetical protein